MYSDAQAPSSIMRRSQDLTRITLAVLFIGSLLVASFWVLQPFLPAIIWAMTLVLATWPVMRWVQSRVGNRRGIAVLVMTLTLLLLVIVPMWAAISLVVGNLDEISGLATTVMTLRVPPPPDWIAELPIIGRRIAEAWGKLTSNGVRELAPRLAPYAGAVTQWFASAAGSVGSMLVHFLLTTAIAAVMYAGGEHAADRAIRFGRKLAGDRGELGIRLTGQAIRSVALGVVVTAVTQSVIAGLGMAIAGVPFTAVLTALIFLLCLIQLGPSLVMAPAVIWMYYSGENFWATILLIFTIVAATIDQFIRPVLIRRGADLPLLLILAGVIGGLVAFGMIGIFIGPAVLAVTYTLLNAWIDDDPEPELTPAAIEANVPQS